MSVRVIATGAGLLGCCLFPTVVMAMVLTYKEETPYGVPGPFPYNAVDYIFFADLFYTAILIVLMRRHRTVTALVAIPLLVITAVMVFFAGMWFYGQYF
jgi:hypothetical protein